VPEPRAVRAGPALLTPPARSHSHSLAFNETMHTEHVLSRLPQPAPRGGPRARSAQPARAPGRARPSGRGGPRERALDESTGSMELRARMTAPSRRNVRLARDRMMPGSTTRQCTSGPILVSTSRLTIPPSTTTRSPGCRALASHGEGVGQAT